MARREKELHQQMYPGWSARDNYATRTKKKKKKKKKTTKTWLTGIDTDNPTVSQYRDPLSLEKGQRPHALTTYRRRGNTLSRGTPLKKKKKRRKRGGGAGGGGGGRRRRR